MRFIVGHVGNLNMQHKITSAMWVEEDRNYSTPCWIWLGEIAANGYGRVRLARKRLLAHRSMYEQTFGRIPDYLQVDHLCRERACINPSHFELVPQPVNVQRGDIATLTPDDVRAIRAPSREPIAEIAERYGVTLRTIHDVRSRRTWKNID